MAIMQQKDHIDFWVQTALRDWEVANDLYLSGKYMYSLFFAHLTIEKLLKAHWLMETELPIITAWNLEARYQDYKDRFYKACTSEYTTAKLKTVNELKECLIKDLL